MSTHVTRRGGARRLGRARMLAAAALLGLPGLLSTAGCGSPADAATSQDITVMTWSPSGTGGADRPGMTALAEAVARKVDAAGGVGGHRLKVLTCNEHNTAAGATACAQRAVDAGAVAVVGSYSQYGDDIFPILENNDIPYIGGYGLSSAEFRSPNSYPVNGGTPALLAGLGRQLVLAGCKSVAVVRPDTEPGDVVFGYLAKALAKSGLKPLDVRAAEQATDYTTTAQKAIGTDAPQHCVTAALDADPTQTFLDAYRRLPHRNTRLSSVIGSFQQSVLDATGGDTGPLSGAYASSWYPAEPSRVWDGLRATAHTYAPGNTSIDASDPGVQTTWVAYQVFLETVQRLGPGAKVSGKSLIQALDTEAPIPTGGATPPLSWRLNDMLASVDTPRLVNTSVIFQRVRNGQFVDQQQKFTDVRWVLTSGT